MAWTHYVQSDTDTLQFVGDTSGNVIVAIDRSVYVIGYDDTEKELQVHIFSVETSTWDVLSFPDDTSGNIPRDMENYFAVAQDDSILVYAQDRNLDCSLFILNTKSMQWKRLYDCNIMSGIEYWWGGCLLQRDLYILILQNINYELWALDLGIMRWRLVSEIEMDPDCWPQRLLACDTHIFVHVDDQRNQNNNINIVYYDTVNKMWEWLVAPWDTTYTLPPWSSFFYSNYFYYVSGISNQREFVFRYSLERFEWERIRFEGIPPSHTFSIGNVVVADNKAIFLEFWEGDVHVLDFKPSLKTRCLAAVSKYGLDASDLPRTLQTELLMYRRPVHD